MHDLNIKRSLDPLWGTRTGVFTTESGRPLGDFSMQRYQDQANNEFENVQKTAKYWVDKMEGILHYSAVTTICRPTKFKIQVPQVNRPQWGHSPN